MKRQLTTLSSLALVAFSSLALADQRQTQIQLEVRFVEATSEALRDIGGDIGWGGGLSVNFASDERASAIPFIGISWDRMTGDNGFRSDISGAQVGFRFRANPNTPLSNSQTSFVLAEGYFRNKHRDDQESETSKAIGFDIGVEVGPVIGGKTPTWRFLYARRPKTFGEPTQLLIVTASFPVSVR